MTYTYTTTSDAGVSRYICPHCNRMFLTTHPFKAGGRTSRAWIDPGSGIARANFNRHVKACAKKQQ